MRPRFLPRRRGKEIERNRRKLVEPTTLELDTALCVRQGILPGGLTEYQHTLDSLNNMKKLKNVK